MRVSYRRWGCCSTAKGWTTPPKPAYARLDRADPADPALALDVLACKVRDEPDGNRNNILFWAACRAFEEGIRADIAEAVLLRAATSAGLQSEEALRTIRSARSHVLTPA